MPRTLEIRAPGEETCRLHVRTTTRIGRAPECELHLGYRGISRFHARIEDRDGRMFVADEGSTNGTFVNGSRLADHVELRDGDEIRVGPVRIRYSEAARFVDAAREATLAAATLLDFDSLPPASSLSYDTLVREYEKQRAVVQVTHRLGAETTEAGVLQRVLDHCFEVLPVQNAVVLVKDSDSGWLRRRAQRSSDGSGEVKVSRSVIQRVMETGTGVCVLDGVMDPLVESSHSFMELGVRSVLAVPLVVGGEVTGALVVDNRQERRAFNEHDLHMLSGVAAAAGLALQRLSLLDQVAREARRRERLERLLAPAVVQEVLDGRVELDHSGRVSEVVVLFADVRGFTPLSRRLGPRRTLETLNAYFRLAVGEVDRCHGMIDKFVGDALVAVWGIPAPHQDDGELAIRCALGIHERLTQEPILGPDGEPLACGIGVHRGPAVVGMVGTQQRMQFTVIGDTVNLGARLCALARPGRLVVHADLVTAVRGPWVLRPLPEAEVKGFPGTQRLYEVEPAPGTDDTIRLDETPRPTTPVSAPPRRRP